jgi:hypothetical protein
MKFGSKLWKFFNWNFQIDQILYHFVSFTAKIFYTAWISQLPIFILVITLALSYVC